jgi:hypothetical protein
MCDGHHIVLAKKLDCVPSSFDSNPDFNYGVLGVSAAQREYLLG